jgi:hypothetical protein
MIRNALAGCALGLTLAGPAAAFDWGPEVSDCEPTLGRVIARHLQCRAESVVAPCGKIQAVQGDLGGLARFQVLWLTGTRAEVPIGPHEDQLCILASRYIDGRSMASSE